MTIGKTQACIRKLTLHSITAIVTLLFVTTVTGIFTASAQAQSFSVLYTFTGGADGGFPQGDPLTLDSVGNIYGSTGQFGATETVKCKKLCGNIFKLTPSGELSSLHTFQGKAKGYLPGGVVMDQSGNFYGAVAYGGPDTGGFVYKLGKLGKTGKLTVLHNFPATSGDGQIPGGIFLDSADNIYGLTASGGLVDDGCPFYGCGIVFGLTPTGNETILDLSGPTWAPSGLVRDAAGNLYGTSILGGGTGCGGFGCGTVFKIDTTGNLTVLYAFQGAPDGNSPEGQLALDSAGNLYGATWTGGNSSACSPSGCGTVYKLDPSGKETILHRFSRADGAAPQGGVILDSAGNLYGTTNSGGTSPHCQPAGCGTVFKVDKKGNETVLYNFTGGTDGGEPVAGLAFDTAGNLYGTSFYGGYTQGDLCFPSGCGTVFKVTP